MSDSFNIEGSRAINNARIPDEVSVASFDSPPKNAGQPCSSDTVLSNKNQITLDSPRALRLAAETPFDRIDSNPDLSQANEKLTDSRQISQLLHLTLQSAHFLGSEKAS